MNSVLLFRSYRHVRMFATLLVAVAVLVHAHDWILLCLRHATTNPRLHRLCDKHLGTCYRGIDMLASRLSLYVSRGHWNHVGDPWCEEVLLKSPDTRVDLVLAEKAGIPVVANYMRATPLCAMQLLWLRTYDVRWLARMHDAAKVFQDPQLGIPSRSAVLNCYGYLYQCIANAKMLQCASIPSYIVEHFELADITSHTLADMSHEQFIQCAVDMKLAEAQRICMIVNPFCGLKSFQRLEIHAHSPFRGTHPIEMSRASKCLFTANSLSLLEAAQIFSDRSPRFSTNTP